MGSLSQRLTSLVARQQMYQTMDQHGAMNPALAHQRFIDAGTIAPGINAEIDTLAQQYGVTFNQMRNSLLLGPPGPPPDPRGPAPRMPAGPPPSADPRGPPPRMPAGPPPPPAPPVLAHNRTVAQERVENPNCSVCRENLNRLASRGIQIHRGICGHEMCQPDYLNMIALTPRTTNNSDPNNPRLDPQRCPICRQVGYGKYLSSGITPRQLLAKPKRKYIM